MSFVTIESAMLPAAAGNLQGSALTSAPTPRRCISCCL